MVSAAARGRSNFSDTYATALFGGGSAMPFSLQIEVGMVVDCQQGITGRNCAVDQKRRHEREHDPRSERHLLRSGRRPDGLLTRRKTIAGASRVIAVILVRRAPPPTMPAIAARAYVGCLVEAEKCPGAQNREEREHVVAPPSDRPIDRAAIDRERRRRREPNRG